MLNRCLGAGFETRALPLYKPCAFAPYRAGHPANDRWRWWAPLRRCDLKHVQDTSVALANNSPSSTAS